MRTKVVPPHLGVLPLSLALHSLGHLSALHRSFWHPSLPPDTTLAEARLDQPCAPLPTAQRTLGGAPHLQRPAAGRLERRPTMSLLQSQLVLAFAQAVTELVTVEKKNIVALTEIARDALRTEPQSAPSLAALITNRILQAPPTQKLPVLYLLDSISKLVGEPYKTFFVPALPEVYVTAWQQGGSGLHRPLDKLLGTWSGVFPNAVLSDIHGRIAALRAAQAAQQVQAAAAMNGYGGGAYGYGAMVPAPMATDPRLAPFQKQNAAAASYASYPAQQPSYYQQAPPQPALYHQQQQQPAAAPLQQHEQTLQQQQPPQVNVTDLLASLMDAGLLAGPNGHPGAAQMASGGSGLLSTPPYVAAGTAAPPYAAATTATPEREQPASTRFATERIKECNPSAVARLLRQTEATKSRFLDRKFLRRQQRAAGAAARASRMWYVDLDTWMASTVGALPGGMTAAGAGAAGRGAGQGEQQAAVVAEPPQSHSVPVDDSQTHCALSGEQFEQFWDEEHQEWRYRDAKMLDSEEAASYGLQEGAIVLVSTLGKPAASVLQDMEDNGGGAGGGGGGVLAELQARQEIAADLAAAAAAAASGGGQLGGAADSKQGLKHPLEEEELHVAVLAGAAEEQPQEKRARVG
ncbi:hypothetical protein D9Q98_000349 [Chlorella vulgaris]|uniref:CID domain-containing protein n=1 Tax=Chlorella vulgaris TaxID=3077 RepID=A0A9D4Z1H0_CHLVU|nr:hypothetical protein D9Q98_000349 [Chlorella vulgaris]